MMREERRSMKEKQNAPAGKGGRAYMIKEVFSHGLAVRMKCIIPQHPASRRVKGGEEKR